MKNNGQADASIRTANNLLRIISKHASLDKPEEVEQFIANLKGSNTYKHNLCKTYLKYCRFYQIQWKPIKYDPDTKAIKIPTKEKLEMLIASAGTILSIKLQISMETGMRPIEVCNLKLRDINLDQKQLYPSLHKHGAPRIARMRVPKMVKNGFNSWFACFSRVRGRQNPPRNQEQTRSPKPSLDHEGRIKTILGQFRNKHAR